MHTRKYYFHLSNIHVPPINLNWPLIHYLMPLVHSIISWSTYFINRLISHFFIFLIVPFHTRKLLFKCILYRFRCAIKHYNILTFSSILIGFFLYKSTAAQRKEEKSLMFFILRNFKDIYKSQVYFLIEKGCYWFDLRKQ